MTLLRGAGYLRGTVWPHLPETKHRKGVSAPREGGGPSYGRGANLEGKLGQGAQGDCSLPASLLAPGRRSWELLCTKHLAWCPARCRARCKALFHCPLITSCEEGPIATFLSKTKQNKNENRNKNPQTNLRLREVKKLAGSHTATQ